MKGDFIIRHTDGVWSCWMEGLEVDPPIIGKSTNGPVDALEDFTIRSKQYIRSVGKALKAMDIRLAGGRWKWFWKQFT